MLPPIADRPVPFFLPAFPFATAAGLAAAGFAVAAAASATR